MFGFDTGHPDDVELGADSLSADSVLSQPGQVSVDKLLVAVHGLPILVARRDCRGPSALRGLSI